MLVFILGGAKSGKSKWALNYAEKLKGINTYYYLATAIPFDNEMQERIKEHQKERDKRWNTLEEPLELPLKLKSLKAPSVLVLVDCLTLWVSNLLYYRYPLEKYFQDLLTELSHIKEREDFLVLLVSNEVGLSLVPESELGRLFRDYSGILNQKIASLAKEVYFIVAGLPIKLKSES